MKTPKSIFVGFWASRTKFGDALLIYIEGDLFEIKVEDFPLRHLMFFFHTGFIVFLTEHKFVTGTNRLQTMRLKIHVVAGDS